MSNGLPVDAVELREEVKSKYRDVAVGSRGEPASGGGLSPRQKRC